MEDCVQTSTTTNGLRAISRGLIACLALVLMSLVALGLPSAVRAQTPTPSATPVPANPNWCPGVPESPPPPRWSREAWAEAYKFCSSPGLSHSQFVGCGHTCMGARGAWGSSKNPPLKQMYPLSGNKPQGPFPAPGGGEVYVLPLAPTPATPAATSTPGAPQGSADPPGLVAWGSVRWSGFERGSARRGATARRCC